MVVVVGACSTGIAGKMGKRDEMDGDGRVATAARTAAAALTCLSSLSWSRSFFFLTASMSWKMYLIRGRVGCTQATVRQKS